MQQLLRKAFNFDVGERLNANAMPRAVKRYINFIYEDQTVLHLHLPTRLW